MRRRGRRRSPRRLRDECSCAASPSTRRSAARAFPAMVLRLWRGDEPNAGRGRSPGRLHGRRHRPRSAVAVGARNAHDRVDARDADECSGRRHPGLRGASRGRRHPRDAAHRRARRPRARLRRGPTRCSVPSARPAGGCPASGIAGTSRTCAPSGCSRWREDQSDGRHAAAVRALAASVASHTGGRSPVNIDGALAVALTVLRLDPEYGDFLFAIARSFGLAAHAVEERTRERPMRMIDPTAALYDGEPVPKTSQMEASNEGAADQALPRCRADLDRARRPGISSEGLSFRVAQVGSEEFMAGITVFEPGESSSYHVHTDSEEINLVLAGSGTLVSEDEEEQFETGDAMWVPKGVHHQHRNTGRSRSSSSGCIRPRQLFLAPRHCQRQSAKNVTVCALPGNSDAPVGLDNNVVGAAAAGGTVVSPACWSRHSCGLVRRAGLAWRGPQ